jgi:hypothetical protein
VRTTAKIISFIFHPLLLATYLVLLLGKFFPAMLMMISYRNVMMVALFVFAFTFLFPALNLWVFRTLGMISSFQLESRKERRTPFVFIAIMYVMLVYLFYIKLPFSGNFIRLMVVVAALVVTAAVLTFFIKVSVHGLAMGGWIGILMPLVRFAPELLWPTATIIVISGLVISARLYLNAHTLKEVAVGAIAGVIVGYGGMLVMF